MPFRTVGFMFSFPSSWSQSGSYQPLSISGGDFFGATMSMAQNFQVVVAAPNDQSSTGSVYVYSTLGNTWTSDGSLSVTGMAAGDMFGQVLFYSGNRVIIGAPGVLSKKGAAYVFERLPDGTWVQIGNLTAQNRVAGDQYVEA